MANQQVPIHYRIRWKPTGHQPGANKGISAGMGDQLRSLVLLRDHPDPKRLDLRASLRDPFERLWVKDFNLNAALKVIVLVDVSKSMGYVGQVSRIQVAGEITAQLALSAYKSGDAFGVFTANEALKRDCMLPPRLNRSAWLWVKQQFSKIIPEGKSAAGLLNVASMLPQKRSLVFIISDFRWPVGQLKQLLKKLNAHDVVPILLQDPAEIDELPKSGIAIVRDLETGEGKFVWMREHLHQKISQARQLHVDEIKAVCRQFGAAPFVVKGLFKTSYLTQYFMERS